MGTDFVSLCIAVVGLVFWALQIIGIWAVVKMVSRKRRGPSGIYDQAEFMHMLRYAYVIRAAAISGIDVGQQARTAEGLAALAKQLGVTDDVILADLHTYTKATI